MSSQPHPKLLSVSASMIEKGAKLIGTDRDSDGQAGERMYVLFFKKKISSLSSFSRLFHSFKVGHLVCVGS